MNKRTKGPWRVHESKEKPGRIEILAGGQVIDKNTQWGEVIASWEPFYGGSIQKANISLMALAPEMLELLGKLEDWDTETEGQVKRHELPAWKRLRAFLVKIEGGEKG